MLKLREELLTIELGRIADKTDTSPNELENYLHRTICKVENER